MWGFRGLQVLNDCSGKRIAWGKLSPFIVLFQERMPSQIQKPRTFAAQGFAEQQRPASGLIKACGVKLNKFHITQATPRPISHGDAISAGFRGIGSGGIKLAGSAGCQYHHGRVVAQNCVPGLAPQIYASAMHSGVRSGGQYIDCHMFFEYLDVRVATDMLFQDGGHCGTSSVIAMNNASVSMASLKREVDNTRIITIKGYAFIQQPVDDARSLTGDMPGGFFVDQDGSGAPCVFGMLLRIIMRTHGSGNSTLGFGRIAACQLIFADECDVVMIREQERNSHASGATAHYDDISVTFSSWVHASMGYE